MCRKLESSFAPVAAPSARQAVAPSSLPDFDDWRTPELERVSKIRSAVCVLGWAGRFGHARLVPLEGVVGGRRRIKNLTFDGDRARDARHGQRRGMVSCASRSCFGRSQNLRFSPTRLPAYVQFRASELSRSLCRTSLPRETQCYHLNKLFFVFPRFARSFSSGFSTDTTFFVRTGPR